VTDTIQLRHVVAEACDGPFGSAIKSEHYSDEGARVVRLGNIGDAEWRGDDVAFLDLSYFAGLRRHAVEAGDLLVAGLGDERSPVGRAAVAPADIGPALVKADCYRLRLRGAHPKFVAYCLSSPFGQAQSAQLADGSTRQRLTLGKALSLRIPNLELAEQRAIADYLDAETARIDALIAKKQQLIHLLEERWQATLARAFSHPTGLRLKRLLAAPMAYGVLVPDHALDGPMMLRINDFRHGKPDPASVARISEALHRQYRRTIVQEGDLVVSVVGTLGRAAIVPRQLAGANLNRPLARVQLRPDVPVDLVRMWCGSMPFAHQAELVTGSDSAQPTLNLGDLMNFTLGLPGSVTDWGAIHHRLQREEAWRNQARAAASRQIELLAEHRQALITAAVTGEFAVPGAA
jgi:type I restriction enzyme S subunit